MSNYEHFKEICNTNSDLSSSVIDEFILYYAARQDKLDKEFETRLNRFRHVKEELPNGFISRIKSQYIVHRVLRRGGLINRYLDHAAIKKLETEQRSFLADAAANPWRFSFSEIRSNPAPDFYEMEDVFSGDAFLLYSPSISKTMLEHSVSLWYNLIAFNGACWQTFGPIIFYKSFDIDDIFFFATELNGSIESEEDLLNDMETNPVPYMMLVTGSNIPIIMQGDFETVQLVGESDADMPDIKKLKKDFLVEYVPGVFKLSHWVWSEPPHFAEAFYDVEKKLASLYGLTDHGYMQMVNLLDKHKFNLPHDPDIRLHLPMIMTIKKLLKKNLELNPYSRRFEIEHSPEDEELLDKLNLAFSMALPFINAGEEPDIDAIAKEVGVDPEIVRDLIQNSMERIKKLRGS